MRPIRLFLATLSAIAVGLGVPASVVRGQALDNDKMTLVGDLAPWANGQFSEVAV